jgi:pimeloyl-ACP methyl ester carboxylesterase
MMPAPISSSTPITPLANAIETAAVTALMASGAAALPTSPVKRQAPRKGAGFLWSARSAPRVMRIPLPTPFATDMNRAEAMNQPTKATNYELVVLPTGHWPQVTKPAELAQLILAAVDR